MGAEIGSDGKKYSLADGDQSFISPNGRNAESESPEDNADPGFPGDARKSPQMAKRGLGRKDTGAVFTPKVLG